MVTGGGPVRVLVDASHLGGASANRGIGTYLRGVLPLLAADPKLDVAALAPTGVTIPDGVRRRTITRYAQPRYAQHEHDLRLPFDIARAVRADAIDVVLSPADDPPRRCPVPWVQMLHDVIPLVVDDPSFTNDAQRWRRLGPRIRTAAAVCVNSQCTADDAVRVLGIDPQRVRVAPLGVDPRFHPPLTRELTASPHVLYVGEYGPHKGFAEAFATIGRLADAGLPHELHMVGRLAPWHEPAVRDLLARAPHPERVVLRGYVDDLAAAYASADALVVSSRYEGFGLPALEAMACGTPVAAFDNSALPEVVGSGGVLVRDGDVDALARAVHTLVTDDRARNDASERGIAHARQFTWAHCAAVHTDALLGAAGRGCA
ncbi:MAG TPA: glycosyltransferase family 1 protein [Acidimicrobiia bacterium]